MNISSYTNNAAESGVIVHSSDSKSACITATTSSKLVVSASDFVNQSNNVVVTVFPQGTVANVTLSNSLENIHWSGVVSSGSITNHTVQNVLYGGAAINCNYGSNVMTSDNPISGDTTSTTEYTSKTITDGTTKQIGYIKNVSTVYDAIHYNQISSGALADGKAIGRVIVCNSGTITNGKLYTGGRMIVKEGGVVNNTTINGEGNIDVLPGGTINTISATNDYKTSHIANFATVSSVKRVVSSATYGIPTSGYCSTNGSVVSANIWYIGNTSNVSSAVVGAVSILSNGFALGDAEEINVKDCSCIVGAGLGTALAGTYTLMLSGIRDTDTYFETARKAIWVKQGRTSLTDYLAIKYSLHTDGPYWDICQITSSSDTVTSTIFACAPAFEDVVEVKATTANTAKIAGTTLNVHNNGKMSGAIIPCFGTLNVHRNGLIQNVSVEDYGTLNVNRYAFVGNSASAVKLSQDARFATVVPSVASYVYTHNGTVVQSTMVSSNVSGTIVSTTMFISNGKLIPSSGVSSNVLLPQVYVSRVSGATTLGTIVVSGNACVGANGSGATIQNGDTIYLDSNARASGFVLSSGGKLLVNSGATANGTVKANGVLTILNNANGNATVESGGSLVIEPKGKGTYTLSSGAYMNCTLSRYVKSNIIAGNSGLYGYTANEISAASWSLYSGTSVNTVTFSSASGFNINYVVTMSDSTQITGLMSGLGSNSINGLVYSGTGRLAIKDIDDTLALVLYNSGKTDSELIGEAIPQTHNLAGLVFSSAYTVPVGANAIINVTDRITFSGGMNVSYPISCAVNLNGDILVNGLTVEISANQSKPVVMMNGYSSSYKHVAEITSLNANSGCILSIGNYAAAKSIPLGTISSYKPIEVYGDLTVAAEPMLYLAQGSSYQNIVTSSGIITAVGINATGSDNAPVTASMYAYGIQIQPSVYANESIQSVLANGCAIGPIVCSAASGSNGTIDVAQSGILHHPAAEAVSGLVVVSGNASSIIDTGYDEYIHLCKKIYSGNKLICQPVVAKLSKGYTNSANVISEVYHIYTSLRPIMAGTGLHSLANTSNAILPEEPFWFKADGTNSSFYPDTSNAEYHKLVNSVSGNISMRVYTGTGFTNLLTFAYSSGTGANNPVWYNGVYQLEYISSTDTRSCGTSGTIGSIIKNNWVVLSYTDNARSAIAGFEKYPANMLVHYNNARAYQIYSCTSASSSFGDMNWTVLTAGSLIGSWTCSYDLNSRYRSPICNYWHQGTVASPSNYTANYDIVFQLPAYTNDVAIFPCNTVAPVNYITKEDALVSMYLGHTNDNMQQQVYRGAFDAEGNTTSTIYHKAGWWVNKGNWFYDSGIVVTKLGKVGVRDRELVAPTILSKGVLYVYSSAVVRNITQERFGVLNTNFNRGYFVANGHTVQITSSLKGKLDDYVVISGSAMVGDGSSYMLSMANTMASGDDRTWTNKFIRYNGDKTISKYVMIGTVSSGTSKYWNAIWSTHTKYTNPVSTVANIISSATVDTTKLHSALAQTEWTKGLISFNGSGVMRIDYVNSASSGVDIGSMYWVKYAGISGSNMSYTYQAGLTGFTSQHMNALSNTGMFVTTSGTYAIIGSGTDMKVMSFYNSANKYIELDTLEGIITATNSATIRLENLGHTRDPWWISAAYVDNEKLNTYSTTSTAPIYNAFVGGSIMRMNTKNFEIADRTSDLTFFKVLNGMTIESTNSTYSGYITLSSSYIGYSGGITCNYNGVIDNCNNNGGYLWPGICGTVRNVNINGAAGILSTTYHHRYMCLDNVSLVSNAILQHHGLYGNESIANKHSSVTIATGVQIPVVSTPIHMSGTSKLYTSMTEMQSRNTISGFTGALEDYIYIIPSGYINTPYLLCSNIYMFNAQHWGHQYDNYDYPTQYNSYVFDHNSTFNNISGNYWSGLNLRAITKNYVVSSGQQCYIRRNGTFLDLEIRSTGFQYTADRVFSSTNIYYSKNTAGNIVSCAIPTVSYGKTIPSSTYYAPAVARYDVPYWDKQAWVTPRLTTAPASGYNYWNTVACFTNNGADNWNNNATTASTYNTTYRTPVFSSGTAGTIVNGSGYNYYMFNNVASSVIGVTNATATVSHTIVHMKPGTILSGATIGVSGGLFVDNGAMAVDIDCAANYSSNIVSTIAGNTVMINRLHLQNVVAMNGGIVIVKPNAAFIRNPATSAINESTPAELLKAPAPACAKGQGHVFYGLVSGIAGVYGEATPSNCVSRTDTSRTEQWLLNTSTSKINNVTYTTIQYGWVNSNLTVGTAAARLNVAVYNDNGLYIGPSGTLNCSRCLVYAGGVLITNGNINASKVIIYPQASLVVMDGTKVNLNTRISCATGSSGHMYRIDDGATVQIMSNFTLANIPNEASDACISNSSCIIRYCVARGGYDTPASASHYDLGLTATASNTSVGGITYPIFTGSGNDQIYSMYYTSSIIDPNTSKVFSGWVITGRYQPYPLSDGTNITSSGTILYACSHVNPIGCDWMNIKGRNVAPFLIRDYDGVNEHGTLSHFAKYAKILDCGHTNVTTLYAGYDIKKLPKIIHVNGYISGAVNGEPSIGETGVIASGTTFANDSACIHIYDQVIREDRIPTLGVSAGLVRFHGTTILDYHGNSDKIVISTMNDVSIGECKFTMTRGTTSVYNFNIGEVTDPVVVNEYTFEVNVLSSTASTTLIPFVIKKCTFTNGTSSTAADLTNLLFDQTCSAVTLSDVRAKMMHVQYKLDLYSGASALIDSAVYKARVNSGATLHVTNYGRNIVVESGGTLYLDPEYDLNVKVYTGSSLCGLVGFENYRFTCNPGTSTTKLYERVWTCTKDANIQIYNNHTSDSYQWYIKSDSISSAIGPACVEMQGPEEVFDSTYFDIHRTGSGIAKIDNLYISKGGTAYIRGYVTGYEAESGAVVYPATVDSMYIRPNKLFAEDYTWSGIAY